MLARMKRRLTCHYGLHRWSDWAPGGEPPEWPDTWEFRVCQRTGCDERGERRVRPRTIGFNVVKGLPPGVEIRHYRE